MVHDEVFTTFTDSSRTVSFVVARVYCVVCTHKVPPRAPMAAVFWFLVSYRWFSCVAHLCVGESFELLCVSVMPPSLHVLSCALSHARAIFGVCCVTSLDRYSEVTSRVFFLYKAHPTLGCMRCDQNNSIPASAVCKPLTGEITS